MKAGDTFAKAAAAAQASQGVKIEAKTLPAFTLGTRPQDLGQSVAGALEHLEICAQPLSVHLISVTTTSFESFWLQLLSIIVKTSVRAWVTTVGYPSYIALSTATALIAMIVHVLLLLLWGHVYD